MKETTREELEFIFAKQKRHAGQIGITSAAQRINRLKGLRDYLLEHRNALFESVHADLKKPEAEILLSELFVVTSELSHVIRNLKRWMQPEYVADSLTTLGTSGYVQYEAKGNALIIAPWNYPVSLALKPLISALAAGCVVMIKPSELSPYSSRFIARLVKDVFREEEVAVILGGVDIAQELLRLPFNHVFFTGSPVVGKIVMKAAAEHLASVTLELGGKSPAIVDESAAVGRAARNIVWGKFFNNGQTCVAPDHVWVHTSLKDAFLEAVEKALKDMYGGSARESESYGRIINDHHFHRLKDLLSDAVGRGAKVVLGGANDEENRYIEPTVLVGVPESSNLMQEEIFGPLLPVLEYTSLSDVIDFVNSRPKPLVLYIHSRDSANIRRILQETSSGNALVNEVLMHYGHHDLPFGGINTSGIGKSNGLYGFREFSNQKGVLKRRFGSMRFLYPPYQSAITKAVNYLLRFL